MSHAAVPLYSAVNYKEASFGVYSVGLAFRIAADSNLELYIYPSGSSHVSQATAVATLAFSLNMKISALSCTVDGMPAALFGTFGMSLQADRSSTSPGNSRAGKECLRKLRAFVSTSLVTQC